MEQVEKVTINVWKHSKKNKHFFFVFKFIYDSFAFFFHSVCGFSIIVWILLFKHWKTNEICFFSHIKLKFQVFFTFPLSLRAFLCVNWYLIFILFMIIFFCCCWRFLENFISNFKLHTHTHTQYVWYQFTLWKFCHQITPCFVFCSI